MCRYRVKLVEVLTRVFPSRSRTCRPLHRVPTNLWEICGTTGCATVACLLVLLSFNNHNGVSSSVFSSRRVQKRILS